MCSSTAHTIQQAQVRLARSYADMHPAAWRQKQEQTGSVFEPRVHHQEKPVYMNAPDPDVRVAPPQPMGFYIGFHSINYRNLQQPQPCQGAGRFLHTQGWHLGTSLDWLKQSSRRVTAWEYLYSSCSQRVHVQLLQLVQQQRHGHRNSGTLWRGPPHSLPPAATGAPIAVVAWLALLPLAVGAGACRFTSTCSHLWSLLSYWSLPMHLDSTCGGRARVGGRKCVGKLGVGAGALKEAPNKPL